MGTARPARGVAKPKPKRDAAVKKGGKTAPAVATPSAGGLSLAWLYGVLILVGLGGTGWLVYDTLTYRPGGGSSQVAGQPRDGAGPVGGPMGNALGADRQDVPPPPAIGNTTPRDNVPASPTETTTGKSGTTKPAPGTIAPKTQVQITLSDPSKMPKGSLSTAARIQAALEVPVDAKLVEVPLGLAVRRVFGAVGEPVRFDDEALSEEGVSLEMPVSLDMENAAARSIALRLLEPLLLSVVVRDETLYVTTAVRAQKRAETPIIDFSKPVESKKKPK